MKLKEAITVHNKYRLSISRYSKGFIYCGFCYLKKKQKVYVGDRVEEVRARVPINPEMEECPSCHGWLYWRTVERGSDEDTSREKIQERPRKIELGLDKEA